MKKLRVLVMMHEALVPPDSIAGISDEEMLPWKSEFDVLATLRNLGHEARAAGLSDDLTLLRRELSEFRPQVVFNMLEEFHGSGMFDTHVVSFLELMKQQYTGCNPRGLLLARDKALTKKILTYHRIATPKFTLVPRGKKFTPPKRLHYPLLVKSVSEDASFGITEASVVNGPEALVEQIQRVHSDVRTAALVEEYISGREFYVGVIGNQRLQTFPIWELRFTKAPADIPQIATAEVKWDYAHQKKLGVHTGPAKNLPDGLETAIIRLCKRVYRALELSGYARMDLRLDAEGKPHVLEANPNPNLSYGEDFAESGEAAGLKYPELIQRLVNLGLSYKAPWI